MGLHSAPALIVVTDLDGCLQVVVQDHVRLGDGLRNGMCWIVGHSRLPTLVARSITSAYATARVVRATLWIT